MLLKRFYCVLFVVFFLLSACSSKSASPTANAEPPTGVSAATQSNPTAEVIVPTNTPEPSPTPTVPPTATFTPEPSPAAVVVVTTTVVVNAAPVVTSTVAAATSNCTNRASLVKHLSFADNSTIFSGLFFGKSWRIQNTGTCTWTTGYSFVYASGEQMSATAENPLPHAVQPGDSIDIQILMKAPDVANTYTGDWMLRDANGVVFGTGDMGDQPIEVQIVVKYPSTKDFHPFPECG